MTTPQKALVALIIAAAVTAAVYEVLQAAKLRRELARLQQEQQTQETALSNQVRELTQEITRTSNQLASVSRESSSLKKNPGEVLKLRGEVGVLRQEKAALGSKSPISKVTSNPESRKMLRDQQKVGMGMIYKGFAKQAKLTTEQSEQLNDLLADHIMDNVDNVTVVLRDKVGAAQMNELFVAQEAALQEKVRGLVGDDGLKEYQEYTRTLLSRLTTDQFKGNLSGNDVEREEKSKRFSQALQEETEGALANAGLPADYQTVPILNFRNIASADQAESNLKLLGLIFDRAAERSSAFLSPEEVTKFRELRDKAIENNRSLLSINRKMMEPIAQ
jgi:hypothetical protein